MCRCIPTMYYACTNSSCLFDQGDAVSWGTRLPYKDIIQFPHVITLNIQISKYDGLKLHKLPIFIYIFRVNPVFLYKIYRYYDLYIMRIQEVCVCVSVRSCSWKDLSFPAHPFTLPKFFWPRITIVESS